MTAICKACHQTIRLVAPGMWGHVANPTWLHHYPKPIKPKKGETQ